jgi:hypothetical protein
MLDTRVFKDKWELSNAIREDEMYVGELLSTLQLDSRIIADLAEKNLIKDLRMLRLIRLSAPVDEKGVSKEQWELYRMVLFSKMSRNELARLLKKKSDKAATGQWKLKESGKRMSVSFDISKMDQAKKEKLAKLMNEKMQEINDLLID